MPSRKFFLQARPPRTCFEALLVAFCLLALLFITRGHSQVASAQGWSLLFFSPCALVWLTIRLRIFPHRSWLRQWAVDLAIAGLLALVLNLLVVTALFSFGMIIPNSNLGSPVFFLIIAVAELADLGGFAVCRGAARLLLLWSRLRRKHLLWSLTNSHVLLVLMAAGLLITAFELLALYSSMGLSVIISATFSMLVLTCIALAIIIPPSALFSYFVMRHTTERLRMLAEATRALRVGNYQSRVQVVGEDEVAQLQSDFNAMAIDLERTMRELQLERDTVAGLLKSRRELIASVSHDLRTPVATVRGYLETTLNRWEDGPPPPTLHRDLQVMEDEVLHLQGLTDDLFALARSEVGRLTLRCVPTDLGPLVTRIVGVRAPLAWRSSRVEVVFDTPPFGSLALIDPARLEQSLQNLLHNGVRHTPPGGIVAVVVREESDAIVLQVRDTGEGIAVDELPHIWERFYQANSTRRDTGGSGLGLSLVKEWIEAMQGRVNVESVPGEGTCFTLRLPKAPAESLPLPITSPYVEASLTTSLAFSQAEPDDREITVPRPVVRADAARK